MALAKLTIGDLIAFKEKRRPTNVKVICLEHSNTIGQALKVLAKYRILSAPLIMAASLEDMAEESVEGGRTGAPALIGWVDINDILHALLSFVKKQHEGQIPTSMLLLMSALEAAARPFNDRALITLSGGDDKSLVYETEADASLLQTINGNLLNNAGRPDKVLHRLAVFDASGEVKHVISHLDIVNLLSAQHSTLLGEFADKTLEELALLPSGPGHVVCVDPHVPTLIALDRMATAGVSGAAVVTAAGELVANLSTSDLRGIQPEHLGVLALPVAEFLALLHGTTYLGWAQTSSKQADHPFFANRRRGAPGSPGRAHDVHDVDAVRLVTCSATSPLKEALAKMADNHVHRVYVTDPAAKPQVTAVVTPTDILKWLVTVFQAGN